MKKIILILSLITMSYGIYKLRPFIGFNNNAINTATDTYNYEHNLVVLNKSYYKDLERSVNLYESFEKYFIGAENTPFFIVIPKGDLTLFEKKFQSLFEKKLLRKLPIFLTEQDVLKRCDEPDITYDGGWTQQVIKLCFGLTNIAKYYISIDSDCYFTKPFNPQEVVFSEKGVLKTVSWKLPPETIEWYKHHNIPWFLDNGKENLSLFNTGYEYYIRIKDFFRSKDSTIYGFVNASFFVNSDAIHRMKELIVKKGGYNFSMLIRIVPHEMQWYGEYILENEQYIPYHGLFRIVDSPEQCIPEDGGESMYGVWFQSRIYDYSAVTKNAPINNQLIYKRPATCSN